MYTPIPIEDYFKKETIAIEDLQPETRALIYYALKSLKNEIQRFQDYSEMNPASTFNQNDIRTFHNNVKLNCTKIMMIIEACSAKGTLSLFQHFAKL